MHPSILRCSSDNEYSLNLLSLTNHSKLPQMPDGEGYLNQGVLFGPDAAIEVKDGKLSLFLNGVMTENAAFRQFVGLQEASVLARAQKLITRGSDVVVFLGKWYHVDFDREPFFRPYIIRILGVDGTTKTLPSNEEIFSTDEENQYYKFDDIEFQALAHDPKTVFQERSEVFIRKNVRQPLNSGFNSFGGFLWHPTVEGHPIVYVPLDGAVTHRTKFHWKRGQDLDPIYVEQFKDLDRAILGLKAELRCTPIGVTSGDLLDAYVLLHQRLSEMSGDDERSEARRYVTALLGDLSIDVSGKVLAEKPDLPSAECIALQRIPLETKAKGYWLVQRNGPGGQERDPEYITFLSGAHCGDEAVLLTRCPPIEIEGFDKPCIYASDWMSSEYGDWRCLAFGAERTLSW
jgi:hypothetical protein